MLADEAAYRRARCHKAAKLPQIAKLRSEVESMLDKRQSPRQISARLVGYFPDDPEMRVLHETVFQSLFVQSGWALGKECWSRVPAVPRRSSPRRTASQNDLHLQRRALLGSASRDVLSCDEGLRKCMSVVHFTWFAVDP